MNKKYYNCAQKVLLAFAEKYKIEQALIDEFKKFGHGKASNNECGALFSAKYLLKNNPSAIKSIEQKFYQRTGETKCQLIRSLNKVYCNDCVEIAIELLQKHEEK